MKQSVGPIIISASLVLAIITYATISYTKNKHASTTHKGQSMETKRHTTKSGLMYEDMVEGTGEHPTRGQHVTVHYTGYLDENNKAGSTFDSSFKRNQPFTFVLGAGQVIKGWDEGVASMKIGGKRLLIVPSNLGYGPYGYPPVIPGGATLYFEVELLSAK